MGKLFRRGLAAFLSVVFVTALSLSYARAQTTSGSGNGFRISPVRSEYTIEKGKSETLTITIENPTDIKTVAQIEVNDFISSEKENGEPRLLLDETIAPPKNSFKNLVSDQEDITLGPREKRDIPVRIAVPTDAGAGGYYGVVRFVPAPASGGGNVGLTASVGTIVLVRVPGNLTEKLDLVQLSASQNDNPKSFFSSGDVNVMVRLKNSGDIHVKPFGKIQVKNMFGKVVHEYELNQTEPRANILPDSIRRFQDAIPRPKGGWFGKYTIVANLGYSQGGGDLLGARASFWYIPTVLIYVIILAILAIVGGVYWFIRKQKARRQHKHDVNKRRS